MNVPTAGVPSQSASSQAVTALILGILSLVCCPIVGPFAWYLGNQERKAVRSGRSSSASEALAVAGMILGILGTLSLVFFALWILLFGGLAVLGGLMEAAQGV